MSREIFYKGVDFSGSVTELFRIFSKRPYAFLLASGLGGALRGRFSLIGFEPFDIFSCSGKDSLKEFAKNYYPHKTIFRNRIPVPFISGAVGFLGYDAGLLWENLSSDARADIDLPDCCFGFYDGIIAIDHLLNKLYLIATGLPVKNSALAERQAKAKIADMEKQLQGYAPKPGLSLNSRDFFNRHSAAESLFQSNFTKSRYIQTVKKALDYIAQGDIYQVNLSQRFCFNNITRHPIAAFDLYASLNALSPSNFSAFFNAGEFQIISHSPEEFLRVQGRQVFTCPMKGTRPRGKDIIEDEILKNELLTSAKEKAELVMVTDLERNDLGRVCEYGSVRVKAMRSLEEYATVFQTTATIEGLLKKDKDVFDLIRACFPSGSVTGCPKIRAMQIIDDLEKTKRGPYTGSLGYLSFDGQAGFNILIRSIVQKQQDFSFHVGGGIVADSVPEHEYDETLIKAKAMQMAFDSVFLKQAKHHA